MEGDNRREVGSDDEEETRGRLGSDAADPRLRKEALVIAISQYQDVYPVLQRAVQFLCEELSQGSIAGEDDQDVTCTIESFIKTGALVGTVRAMVANLDSPAFISSCFELLTVLTNSAEERLTAALMDTEILGILDKVVHRVAYQNEPSCIQRGICLLSKLAKALSSIGNTLWTQLVATTAQAMLTNSEDNSLALECVLCLKLLFQLKTDVAVPPTSANVILKTLDQCTQQPTALGSLFSSAAVDVMLRILDAPGSPHLGYSAPILAAGLQQYQLKMDLNDSHKRYVEELIQEPLQSAVPHSLATLIKVAVLQAESLTETQETAFQTAAKRLLLGVVWRDEARVFLDSGGLAVLANAFAAGSVVSNVMIETALAQTLYYVSMHWPDEMWNEIRVNGTGISKWIEVMDMRCKDEAENDGVVQYLLAMVNTLLRCEGFCEAFTESNGVFILMSVLRKRELLPICTQVVVSIITSVPDMCRTNSLPTLCCLVADTMLALDAHRSTQLECVTALTLLISRQDDGQALLSIHQVRDIVRVMRSKLTDCPFVVQVLGLVVNSLLNSSIRASFIDRGLLQVVSKAICMYQWSAAESAGSDARWIISDVSHKLDVTRNLGTLEPHAHISKGLTVNPPAISTEALDACCSVLGALASVKPLLPLLIEEGAIRCLVGMLRYAKQDLITRSESSFVQLVMTCFFALSSIVSAPIVTQVVETVVIEATHQGVDGRAVHCQLIDSGADDAIIGCLAGALRVWKSPPLLVDSGCRLLQAVLAFPISVTSEVENRWIAVATSTLQRHSTLQKTRELIFATTLMLLSRGKRSVEVTRGQHVKMMKVILGGLNDAIQHESSCTLLQAQCTGAIRVLEEIAKACDSLSDTLVSRVLGVLGKLIGMFILSPSTSAQDNLVQFDNAVALFAKAPYVDRLIRRLDKFMAKEDALESVAMADLADDFKALEALLYCSQVKKTIDDYHRLFGHLAAVVENIGSYAQALGEHTPFFLELGCLTSQLLPTAQREEVINTALCHFAEDTAWHSMRWIAVLADRGSSEFTLIVEFVLLRIISGHTILEPALLMELLDALNYLLRCSQCREIVAASSHASELQGVLWELVRADLAHLESASDGYDVAVSVLEIISSILASFLSDIFSVNFEEDGPQTLVRFCLEALDNFFSNTSVSLTKVALLEEVLQSSSSILVYCIKLGTEHVRTIIQHRATWHAINIAGGSVPTARKPCQKWCLAVLGSVIRSHGLLYAEKLLRLSSDPFALLISLVGIVALDKDSTSWKHFVDCVSVVSGTEGMNALESDCSAVFVKLRQQSMRLVHGQPTVVNSRRVQNYVTDSIAQLSLKYGQLSSGESHADIDGCLQDIAQSGLAFYDLFNAAPSFGALDFSAVVSLHLRIARITAGKAGTERNTVEESTVVMRELLNPVCISDTALADYIDLAAAVYLSPTVRAAAWLFIDASTNVLSKAIQRLMTGLVRAPCLERSLRNCFSSLQAVYASRWESGEVDSVLELLRISSPDRWTQELLLESVLVLPQGLLYLFELARVAPSDDVQAFIMAFLFQHVHDIRHKTQRIDELELGAILSIIKRNLAGKVGDTCQPRWRDVTGSEMLRSALETLKLFVKRKYCAVLCSDLGGVSTLYNVLCAPSQYEDSIHLALESCCYLAGYGANLTNENCAFALELLFLAVETSAASIRSRLAFLVLEFVLVLKVSTLSIPLIQQCRTQVVPAAGRSYEQNEMFIQQLYITRQKLVPPAAKRKLVGDPNTSVADPPVLQVPFSEREIREIILVSCRRIIQCTSEDGAVFYVDVNTSEKYVVEPLGYVRLQEAIDHLHVVLHDPDMVMDRSYVSALVPALSEVLVLHTTTTATICTVMQVLDQIAFVNPSIILSDENFDAPALIASCVLHQRSSLVFARHVGRFLDSIGAYYRAKDGGPQISVSIVGLLLELMQNWKSDLAIIDQCFSTAHIFFGVMDIEDFELLPCSDVLSLLNTAMSAYIGSSSISWNWLKSVLAVVNRLDNLVTESAQDMTRTALNTVKMFMSHSLMVGKALVLLQRVYNDTGQLHPRNLIESDGVGVLLTCLKLHANDEPVSRACLGLLVTLVIYDDTSHEAVDKLFAGAAAVPILLVCKKNPDDSLICGMCIQLLHRMVASFDKRSVIKAQTSVLPGDTPRKKSELLTHLLEADTIPLLFDLMDNYSIQGNNRLLELLLGLLKLLTKDEHLRESAEVLHGLQELQQTIDRVWIKDFDCALVELAIDCFVNMACSDREIGHGWRELPMWLLQLAESIHKLESDSKGMCVEKLIGILGRLTVDSAICKALVPKGSFIMLELLMHVGDDRPLEQALYGLLCSLCEDIACTQILIVYDAILIASERISSHFEDEDTLLASLCFLDLLVLNIGESYPALQDDCVFEALEMVIQEYPEISGGQVYRIASTILEKVSALDFQASRAKPVQAKPTKALKSQAQVPDSEKTFQDLLLEGAKFRMLWEARPDTVETIQVKLAPSGDYLLFRRKVASQLPRIERVFVSQLEVCPQRSLDDQSKTPRSPPSPSKKILAQSLLRENFEGDRVLRLRVRDEDVLIKTASTRERVYWDQALQWLVSRRESRASPTHSPIPSP